MKSSVINSEIICGLMLTIASLCPLFSQTGYDLVDGNLIQFNRNVTWCWFQDERAIVDSTNKKLIVGFVTGLGSRANIEANIFDILSQTCENYILAEGLGWDDHNAPAFLLTPDGNYLTVYATHFDEGSRFRIFDGSTWSPEELFNWNDTIGVGLYPAAYSNLWYLSDEDRVYNFARIFERSPNMMISADYGDYWTYGGMLTKPEENIGYFKYLGNGVDRIDFINTESHPRDYNTNIFHGYIKDGKSYKSDGTLMDSDITDTIAPKPSDFTLVFADGTIVNGDTMRRCWNADLQRYNDGSIAAIITARINNNEGGHDIVYVEHCFIYCRYNGSLWTYSYLGRAGIELRGGEQDYTGLGALGPNDPNTIYISTTYDPRDNTFLEVHEIFKGVTSDQGSTWVWTPVTRNSTRHNVRPIMPAWNDANSALLWLRGDQYANGDDAVVGILTRENELQGKMTYVDANAGNTTFTDNSPLFTTGPDSSPGPDDNRWHERTNTGNGNTVLTSSETGNGENAPMLKTRFGVPDAGYYDVWVNFWGNLTDEWRVKAGLSPGNMQMFRQMACKQVEPADHTSDLILSTGSNEYLYQAYLGRTQSINDTIEVYIDDEAIDIYSESGSLIGDIARTWYDGISYTSVLSVLASVAFLEISDTNNSSVTFNVFANTEWEITGSGDWLIIDPLSGYGDATVTVNAEENTGESVRTSVLTISADGVPSQTVTVYQLAANPFLNVSNQTLYVDYTRGSTTSFTIESNTIWHLSVADSWLVSDHLTGTDTVTITLTAEENPNSVIRESIVTVSATGTGSQNILVTQDGRPESLIDFNNDMDISLYPVPLNDILNIRLKEFPADIYIYSIEGRLLEYSCIKSSFDGKMDMSAYKRGIYIVKIVTNEKSATLKVLKN